MCCAMPLHSRIESESDVSEQKKRSSHSTRTWSRTRWQRRVAQICRRGRVARLFAEVLLLLIAVRFKSGSPDPHAPGYRKQQRRYDDVCLIDALRCFGHKVPYEQDGPFWAIRDGTRFLAPFSTLDCLWSFHFLL